MSRLLRAPHTHSYVERELKGRGFRAGKPATPVGKGRSRTSHWQTLLEAEPPAHRPRSFPYLSPRGTENQTHWEDSQTAATVLHRDAASKSTLPGGFRRTNPATTEQSGRRKRPELGIPDRGTRGDPSQCPALSTEPYSDGGHSHPAPMT